MSKIINIAINDLRVFMKDRGNIIGLLLIPLVMTFVIGTVNGNMAGSPSRVRVDIIDNDATALSTKFMADLREVNSSLVLCPFDNDEADFCRLGDDRAIDSARAEARLKDENTLAVIEIPAGFEEAVKAGTPVKLVYRSNENVTAPSFILQAVEAVVQKLNGAVVASRIGASVADGFPAVGFKDEADRTAFIQSVYDRAGELWAENPVTVDYQVTETAAQQTQSVSATQAGFGQSVPGMGSMFVMFTVFGGIIQIILERKNWTLQRLAMMPVSRAQLLGGKILSRFLLGILQYLIVFAVGLVVGLNLGKDLLALVVVMVAFTLCVTALSFALATRLRNDMQANSMTLLVTMVLAPLGGAWWPLEVMPDFMQKIGHVSPVAWAMEGYRSLLFENGSLGTVIVPTLVLLAMTAVFFVIGIVGFKYD